MVTSLGLDIRESGETGLLEIHSGDGAKILVYPKPDHEPASLTILNMPVDDIDQAVDGLVEQGIEMLRYPGFEQDGKGIQRGETGPFIAWFTDPSGNILSVLSERS